MPLYRLAKEYGQSPDDVEKWNAKTFDEAWDIYIAENREKWPAEGRVERTQPMNTGFILDRDYNYWRKFVKGGEVDSEALIKANYSDEQVEWLKEEISKAGLLEEGKAEAASLPAHTKPHEFVGDPSNWCQVCGKSLNYKAHQAQEAKETASQPEEAPKPKAATRKHKAEEQRAK